MVTWKKNPGITFHADANKVYQELQNLGNEFTPEDVVNYARCEDTEIHKCFTWNNNEAAEKWRLQEARQVVCHLVIVEDEEKESSPEPVRVFYSISGEDERHYEPTHIIVKDQDKYERLVSDAWSELERFKKKYAILSDCKGLKEIFALIA